MTDEAALKLAAAIEQLAGAIRQAAGGSGYVVVPAKLTDVMRERMAYIADGPLRTYDEYWSSMLDAAGQQVADGVRCGAAVIECDRLRAALKEIARFCKLWDDDEIDQYDAMAAIEHVLDSGAVEQSEKK